jgi:crossover junction endodeoxyribonuclease RusA
MLVEGLFQFWLPWPPSVNTYWRHPTRGPLAGKHLISEKGRLYRKQVINEMEKFQTEWQLHEPIENDIVVEIYAFPPDNRRRDLDNILKSLLDSLEHSGLFLDDNQIISLTVHRGMKVKDGIVYIEMNTYWPAQITYTFDLALKQVTRTIL